MNKCNDLTSKKWAGGGPLKTTPFALLIVLRVFITCIVSRNITLRPCISHR